MASPVVVLLTFLAAVSAFSVMGLGVARRLAPTWAAPAAIAPALGWALFTAVSLPLQTLAGFGRTSTLVCVAIALVSGALLLARMRAHPAAPQPALPPWAPGLALLIALIPLAALLPKHVAGGVIIGSTAFDHSKIAVVDEITRLGLPVGNPFFGADGARSSLAYYYLWHFGAAQVSSLLHVSGWEADAAMVGFTAYASMMLMMGLAAQLSARDATPGRIRRRAAIAVGLVAALSLAGSLRQLMVLLIGWDGVNTLLSTYTGLAGWMVQASWVPQHMQSACCVVLAVMLLIDLATRPHAGRAIVIAALAAAGFGSSAWVGGVTFALCAIGAGLLGLVSAGRRNRMRFIAAALGAAAVTMVLSLPLLKAEFGTLGSRQGGFPIALHPYEVVGAWAPPALRRVMDLPAYWLVLLPVELLAIYPVGVAAIALHLRKDRAPAALGLALLTVVGLATAWLLMSTIGNNDLGWRAILPAVLVLTAYAGAWMARWFDGRAWIALGVAAALALAGGLDRQIFQNLHGRSTDNAGDFARSPALWAAVRKYAGPSDRVANNPQSLDDLTDWPVNPSWAMLANRPSCYSGWETARAYVALPTARLRAMDAQFSRIFDGHATPDDLRQMAGPYGCRVAVIAPDDGAWDHDPFAGSAAWRLAEDSDDWRIYLAAGFQPAKPVGR